MPGRGGRSRLGGKVQARRKVEKGDPLQVGAPMPGLVVRVLVAVGDPVAKGAGTLFRWKR